LNQSYIFRSIALLLLLVQASTLQAELDGKESLVCSASKTIECAPGIACAEVSNDSLDIPAIMRIDFDAAENGAFHDLHITTDHIFLQGYADEIKDVRDPTGWTMAISRHSGKMVLSAAGEEVAFIVYGSCSPIRNL